MLGIYHEAIYRPILNLLVGLYNVFPIQDIGIVIILVTIAIRVILAPFMHKSLKGQRALSALQPKMNELREKHKDNREEQAKAMMDLYKEHKVNPFSSCLPVLIQLPILIALYQVFSKALRGNLDGLYGFVTNPGTLDPKFLGLVDLAHPNIAFALLAGAAQLWQSRMITKWQGNSNSQDMTTKALNIQMTYVLPVISVVIAWTLPAGLPLYWIVTTLFAVAQQYYVQRTHKTIEVV
ncbi:YidC/Oxa1 family membrane protein insertase [bacterium]|nr:MAG: YidC/Oxa1 family membrane protein insertase [bacterium]